MRLLFLLPLLLFGCEAKDPDRALVDACAEVAQDYHGLPNEVRVLDETLLVEDGEVVFSYEVINTRNQPQDGTAACSFTGDPPSLTRALIDGVPLEGERLDALMR